MKITCEVKEYSNPAMMNIRVHNHWCESDKVEIEVEGKRYTVIGREMIEAIKNCMNTGSN